MKRRDFLNAFMGAVATVAIGLKVAEGVPKVHEPEWTFIDGAPVVRSHWVKFEYGTVLLNPNAIARVNTV